MAWRRSKHSSYVGFSLSERESARLSRLAARLGYATLDHLAADLFRIGLDHVDACFIPTTSHERFPRARARVQVRAHEQNDLRRRSARA